MPCWAPLAQAVLLLCTALYSFSLMKLYSEVEACQDGLFSEAGPTGTPSQAMSILTSKSIQQNSKILLGLKDLTFLLHMFPWGLLLGWFWYDSMV